MSRLGHTTTLGGCTTACNPAFDAATNRFAGSQGFTYDANGSLTVDASTQQYTLDAENRQTVLKNGSSVNLAEYSYDGEGKRVRKLVSATGVVTHFVYDAGGTLIEEWTTTPAEEGSKDDPSVSTTSYIYAGSRLISTETSAGTTYITLDHLGSTRVTTDGSGNVTSRKDFMSFGEEAISTERNAGLGYTPPPIRKDYTGYENEAESGLQFAQARFQNPVHGRFTSVDPLTASASIKNPQSFNRYTYVLNSPYKFVDPLGLLSEYSTGACGSRCPNNGPYVDGSAFRGRDASMNWLESYAGELNAATALHETERSGGQPDAQEAEPPPAQSQEELFIDIGWYPGRPVEENVGDEDGGNTYLRGVGISLAFTMRDAKGKVSKDYTYATRYKTENSSDFVGGETYMNPDGVSALPSILFDGDIGFQAFGQKPPPAFDRSRLDGREINSGYTGILVVLTKNVQMTYIYRAEGSRSKEGIESAIITVVQHKILPR